MLPKEGGRSFYLHMYFSSLFAADPNQWAFLVIQGFYFISFGSLLIQQSMQDQYKKKSTTDYEWAKKKYRVLISIPFERLRCMFVHYIKELWMLFVIQSLS